MGAIPSSTALLAIGIGTLLIAWRGYNSGELVVARFFRLYRPNREDNPLGFSFYLGIHIVAGTFYTGWGILILMGVLRPIPWR
jgi:hypothetical protein